MDGVELTWTVSNNTVGELDTTKTITVTGSATSTFTALWEGTTMINATDGSAKGTAIVIVNPRLESPRSDPNGPY